jgi:DNA repair protein RecN (Recombination protein N)
MLKSIEITNYALIQHVRLDLQHGLTAITGETGSGKSIIMGALGLLLGERADTKAILHNDSKCVIEATFDVRSAALDAFFASHDLDIEATTTVRREITAAGKSRSFINDTPVSLLALKEFGHFVIDIHSQHENQLITERSFRYLLVDAFHSDTTLFGAYTEAFETRRKQMHEVATMTAERDQLLQEQDYRLFQLQELEQLNLANLDQVALETERDELSHADLILQALQHSSTGLDDDQNGVLMHIRNLRQSLQKVSTYSPKLLQFDERLQGAFLELKELSADLNDYVDQVQSNPERLDQILETLSALYHLQQKHRVQTTDDLIALENDLRAKTTSTQHIEEKLQQLQASLERSHQLVSDLAAALTSNRIQSAQLASKEIERWFHALGLEQAHIQFNIKPSSEWHAFGGDEIEWLFSANQGVALQSLSKVASGGEISRVMLAIKATLSQRRSLPILILDEIDQGVSGEVGKKIGLVLKAMSSQMQLLTISHLAQIAGQADHQFKVAKHIEGGQTVTTVRALNEEERIAELAEMISGKTKSEAALANARELLN